MNKEIDITNKVILDLDKYIEMREEKKALQLQNIAYEERYEKLIKYLLSECTLRKYSSGRRDLEFDSYNNHLTDYLKQIEPELYEEVLNQRIEEEKD